MKQNEKCKQTLESAQYRLEIIFKSVSTWKNGKTVLKYN